MFFWNIEFENGEIGFYLVVCKNNEKMIFFFFDFGVSLNMVDLKGRSFVMRVVEFGYI